MSIDVSIITPSFQQASYLEECIRSVQEQEFVKVEHLVVDGGSSDGSRAILEQHDTKLAWWCSEVDAGQAAAINKGMGRATGKVFGWLNSDDILVPGALQAVEEAFSQDPELMVVTASRIRRQANGVEYLLPADDAHDTRAFFTRPRVHQSSTFYRMDFVRQMGGLEERLHFVMDLELWWQLMFRHGPSVVKVLDKPLSIFRLHPGSKTVRSQAAFVDETAGLLHGLCLGCGELRLASVLRTGHSWPEGLRPIPVTVKDAPMIRRMVMRFLTHWNRTIHSRKRFEMLWQLEQLLKEDPDLLGHDDRGRWSSIVAQLRVPNWWFFRLRRKVTTLYRKAIP